MNVVRDCPTAKWLPARHHYALTQLIALIGLARQRRTTVLHVDRLVLAIDRDQSAIEQYGVAIWIVATVACYIAVSVPPPFAIAAIPLAAGVIQLPTCFTGPLWNFMTRSKRENNLKLNSILLMTGVFVASSYFSVVRSPVRYVAWFFLAIVILNAAAWVIMALLRNRVRQLEQQCAT